MCCGSGGVGKTTTAAALGLRAAELGRRVVVLTIDPARRLAQSMGLEVLDNTPRPVPGVDPAAGGSLDAMMLDMKRTFDEVVEAHASPDKAEQILANPFYVALSSSFAGTSEYMAMEKLGQLRASADAGEQPWDLVVVDTPPSRSALDFLDAPQRLSSFLDGRFLRLLTAPAKAGGRAYLRALTGVVGNLTGLMTRIIGAQVLTDVQTFVAALDTMFGGFRERAETTYARLQDDGTAFLVVASPDPDALREASYFVERLDAEGMPLAGLVVNRVQVSEIPSLTAARSAAAAEQLDEDADAGHEEAVVAGLLRLHAERMLRRERETAVVRRFHGAHPDVPTTRVAAMAEDVHDLDGLREVGAGLAHVVRGLTPARPSAGRAPEPCRWSGGADDPQRRVRRGVVGAGLLEQAGPGPHVRPALEQGPALALGHPAPHAVLDPVVEGVGQALGAHDAALADDLGLVLGGPLHEQLVGVAGAARAPVVPVLHHVPPATRPPVAAQALLPGVAAGWDLSLKGTGTCAPAPIP